MGETYIEHETVVLIRDHAEHGLRAGDVGTIVHIYKEPEMCDVEFVRADGRPVAILTLSTTEFRKMKTDDMLHVRHV